MANQEGLQKSNVERTQNARARAKETIQKLKSRGEQVNFSTVSKESNVSRHFLYSDGEIRKAIEEQRHMDINNVINKRACFDKTAKSKDVIIEAKDRRIAKLEEENKRLKTEIDTLRGIIYSSKGVKSGSTSGTCT